MFENLDEQINRIQRTSSRKSRAINYAGVLFITLLLFWGLHIGLLIAE